MSKVDLDFLNRLLKGIATQFGDKCEVVLHDFSQGYDDTIVAIENNHVTGRKIGGCLTNYGVEYLKSGDGRDNLNYITTTEDGKVLRSSTILIKDDKGEPMGSVCINLDISDLIVAENAIKSLVMGRDTNSEGEVFAKNISELLDYYLQQCQKVVGKPISLMTKEDRMKALKYLDEKGVFLITKSSKKVCDFFNISKFTLYNQLDEIRSQSERTIDK